MNPRFDSKSFPPITKITRYDITPVESAVRKGYTWCNLKTNIAIFFSILQIPPDNILTTNNTPVTTTAVKAAETDVLPHQHQIPS